VPGPEPAPSRLPRRLRRTVAALARAICDPPPDVAPATYERLADDVERFLGSLPVAARGGLVAALWAFEGAALLVPSSRLRTFSRLRPERAAALYGRWWTSPALHPVAKILKMVVAFSWYELPEVKAAMGYHPERWIAEVSRRRVAQWQEEIARADRDVLTPAPLRGAAPAGEGAAKPEEARDAVAHR
jgi:hypothetical protein